MHLLCRAQGPRSEVDAARVLWGDGLLAAFGGPLWADAGFVGVASFVEGKELVDGREEVSDLLAAARLARITGVVLLVSVAIGAVALAVVRDYPCASPKQIHEYLRDL